MWGRGRCIRWTVWLFRCLPCRVKERHAPSCADHTGLHDQNRHHLIYPFDQKKKKRKFLQNYLKIIQSFKMDRSLYSYHTAVLTAIIGDGLCPGSSFRTGCDMTVPWSEMVRQQCRRVHRKERANFNTYFFLNDRLTCPSPVITAIPAEVSDWISLSSFVYPTDMLGTGEHLVLPRGKWEGIRGCFPHPRPHPLLIRINYDY